MRVDKPLPLLPPFHLPSFCQIEPKSPLPKGFSPPPSLVLPVGEKKAEIALPARLSASLSFLFSFHSSWRSPLLEPSPFFPSFFFVREMGKKGLGGVPGRVSLPLLLFPLLPKGRVNSRKLLQSYTTGKTLDRIA